MIDAGPRAAALERDEVGDVLDHTYHARVAALVRTDSTKLPPGHIAASGASPDGPRGFLQGRHQRSQLFRLLDQKVQSDALGRADIRSQGSCFNCCWIFSRGLMAY
jgi:hypothetical protein